MMTAGVTLPPSSPLGSSGIPDEAPVWKEKIFERAAEDIAYAHLEKDGGEGGGADPEGSDPGPRKVLIVCDRGFFDNCAYMTGDEFRQVLGKLNVTEEELPREL